MTPARRLAESFGNVEAMRALYAPDVEWVICASLRTPRMIGRDAVTAFNRQVWTEHHRPDCTVTILDEVGDQTVSAVRFTYRAFSLLPNAWYENEYTLFVQAGAEGITRVNEAFDSAATIDSWPVGRSAPAGRPWRTRRHNGSQHSGDKCR